MKNIIKSTLILVAITLIAGLALAAVYEMTKEPIAAAEQAAREEAYRAVMPEAMSFSSVPVTLAPASGLPAGVTVDEVLCGTADGTTVGYVAITTSANGYGGDITVAVGVMPDGSLCGISIISQGETAGLGAKCTSEDFTGQFAGISGGHVEFVKTGKTEPNQIDAISGATVTTSAVTEAVNAGLSYVHEYLLTIEEGSGHE